MEDRGDFYLNNCVDNHLKYVSNCYRLGKYEAKPHNFRYNYIYNENMKLRNLD